MAVVKRFALAGAMVAAVAAGTALGHAQARRNAEPVMPLVLSGGDIGFRVEGRKGASVTGRFVVRIDGRWVDAEASFVARPATGGR